MQGVIQRSEVRIDLRLKITRKKAELLSRFHCGPRQDDAVDLLILESEHRHGDGEIGLSRARRADAENQFVLFQRLYIALLAERFALDLPPAARNGDHVAHDLLDEIDVAFLCKIDRVAESAAVDTLAAALHVQHLFDHGGRELRRVGFSLDAHAARIRDDARACLLLDHAEVLIEHAKQTNEVVHCLHGYDDRGFFTLLFCHCPTPWSNRWILLLRWTRPRARARPLPSIRCAFPQWRRPSGS